MLKRQGGFKQGDPVEVRLTFPRGHRFWIDGFVIEDFQLMKVHVKDIAKRRSYHGHKINLTSWVSIFDIRHPHLTKGKKHG